jgi:hypothetical protein
MEDGKGKLWKEHIPDTFSSWASRELVAKVPKEPNFCPICGVKDITVEKITVFGSPGYYFSAECRVCSHKF